MCCRSETVVCNRSSCNHTDRGAHFALRHLNQTLLQFGPPSCQKLTEEDRILPRFFSSASMILCEKEIPVILYSPCSSFCLRLIQMSSGSQHFTLSCCFWIGLVVVCKVYSRISLVLRWKLTVIVFLIS